LQKWTISQAVTLVIPVACIMGGVQAALIVALRIAKERQLQWPLTLMAVLSAALLAAGVLRHYWDIYVHRTVRGISFLFVGIDAAGDVFSLVSVLFQPKIDVLGLVIYGTEFVLWTGVFACGGYYNLLPWAKRKLENMDAVRSMHVEEPITLHNLPSSTSVFRTPSAELEMTRQRTTVSRGGELNGY
jgi:hypothetical protein